MEFVTIPPGSFIMGSLWNEEGRFADEGPLHEVTISCSFELLATEVTQSTWEEVMGSNPSTFINPDNPVETISWADCQGVRGGGSLRWGITGMGDWSQRGVYEICGTLMQTRRLA